MLLIACRLGSTPEMCPIEYSINICYVCEISSLCFLDAAIRPGAPPVDDGLVCCEYCVQYQVVVLGIPACYLHVLGVLLSTSISTRMGSTNCARCE
ncbi:unnamed protein product [Ectocarpus fasciculatus]